MSAVIKKFITLKGSSVDCYNFCKRETGWSDEKMWNTMLTQFGMALGMESRKVNQLLFQALMAHAESQRETFRVMVNQSKKEAAGPRGRGRAVKIP